MNNTTVFYPVFLLFSCLEAKKRVFTDRLIKPESDVVTGFGKIHFSSL